MKSASPETPALKFLVIRRDNIGDLVCTTPLLRALREHFPDARICVLVNSYNAPVLAHNPDVNEVYVYTKAKHRQKGKCLAQLYWERLKLFWMLRREHFDYALLAGQSQGTRLMRLAKFIAPRQVLVQAETASGHEVERVFHMLTPLGIDTPPPPLRVVPDVARAATLSQHLFPQGAPTTLIGIHISARKPSQRWPTERFVELTQNIHRLYETSFLLFWSPGSEANPLHPGDDEKAQQIMHALAGLPIQACPTHQLEELITGLSLCNIVICSDGGAMHLAAGLGKPVLCFFGKSDSTRWHPWGIPHLVLQKPSLDVADISATEALADFEKLRAYSPKLTSR